MIIRRHFGLLAGLILLSACTQEPPPRSVQEFLDNPLLLEAALVRCTQNRAETKYNTECVNAREAVKLIEAQEDAQHRASLEAESQRKREALRRTQQAAAEARRLAEEARRRREEAEYLAQFGELPPADDGATERDTGNEPMAVIPPPEQQNPTPTFDEPRSAAPTAGSNAPLVQAEPEPEATTDLNSIRDELRRRSEEDGD